MWLISLSEEKNEMIKFDLSLLLGWGAFYQGDFIYVIYIYILHNFWKFWLCNLMATSEGGSLKRGSITMVHCI